MKKKLNKLTQLITEYIKKSSVGALICEPLEMLTSDKNCLVSEILPSSKDSFYLVNKPLYQKIESNESQVYTYNGVSSLIYQDNSLNNVIAEIQQDNALHILLICPKIIARKTILNRSILFDDIVLFGNNRDENIIKELLKCSSKLVHASSQKKFQKEIILLKGYPSQELREISLLVFSKMPHAIVIAINEWESIESTSLNIIHDTKEAFVDDHVAIIPHNIPSRINFKNNPLHEGAVTAIINLYKRYDGVAQIYDQLLAQTYPLSYIYVWVNSIIDEGKLACLREKLPQARFIVSDENIGVWARFAYALNNRTEYTVIFDDDTIPGIKWIENCIDNMGKKEALLGTIGLIYDSQSCYMQHKRIGWSSANSSASFVDIVGHSWFFKTDWLRFYWYEFEPTSGNEFCGEDMHFSFALQKQGIPTMVPPHPLHDKELWGSLKALELGMGSEAISVSGKGSHMDMPLQRLVARGFKLINF